MMRTFDVVPSPVMSSWAVATRAIREAVGCWICCKKRENSCYSDICLRNRQYNIYACVAVKNFSRHHCDSSLIKIDWKISYGMDF